MNRKKIINKENLLVTFCILILPILIYWVWFFKFDILTSGDWGFFFKETQLTFLSLPYIWINNSLGSIFISASSYFSYLFTGILSFTNNFPLSERLVYFWPSVLFSSVGSYVLLKKILKNKLGAIIGSFVFSYNTYFILGETGQLTLIAAFSLAPSIIYFFIRTLEEKKTKLAVITGLISFICAAYEFRSFYIIAFVLFFYFIYYSSFIDRFSFKGFLKNSKFALIPIILVLLTNFYWILGLSQIGSITSNEIFNRGLFGNSFMNILRSITLFHPFWTGTKMEAFVVQPIPLYFWLIPIFSFLGLFLNKKNKNVLFFGFISLLGIFLAKQASAPLPNVYQWLYNHFPGFNAFRESSKFYFLIALGYSVLIGSFIDWLWRNFIKNKWQKIFRYGLTILIAGLFLWNTKPLITGEIGTLFVPRQIPQDYLVLKDFILKQPKYFRTLWVPTSSRWGIYTNEKPEVSDVSMIGSDWINFIDYKKHNNNWPVQNQIIDIYNKDFSNQLFNVSSIKYVIVSLQDKVNDDDFFIYYGGEKDQNIRQWYVNQLDKINWLKKIDIGTKDLVVYENENYRDHIYTTKEPEIIYKNVSFNNIVWNFINPTEYKISLKNVKENTYLNFSEKYHPDWSLRAGNFNWFNVLTNKNYFIDSKYHTENDAKLNSFLIDPEYIRNNFNKSTYKENPDGSIDIELTLYFKPQSYFYLGLIISGTTLFGCLGYLGWDLVRRRKKKGNEKDIEVKEG